MVTAFPKASLSAELCQPKCRMQGDRQGNGPGRQAAGEMPSVLNKKRILQRVTKLFNLARSVSSPGKMQFCSKYLPSPSFETGYYLQHNLQGSRMLCSNHTSSWKPMHAHRAVTHAFPLSPHPLPKKQAFLPFTTAESWHRQAALKPIAACAALSSGGEKKSQFKKNASCSKHILLCDF